MTNRQSEYFLPVKRSPFSCLTGSGYDTVRRPAEEEEEKVVKDARVNKESNSFALLLKQNHLLPPALLLSGD